MSQQNHATLPITHHAKKRAKQRGVDATVLEQVLAFGRKTYQAGAVYYSIGRKEINKYQSICPALRHLNGLHVVTSLEGVVLTVFKNPAFSNLRHC